MSERIDNLRKTLSSVLEKIRDNPGRYYWFFVVIALIQAIRFRWVCDDAFISFRYARNLIKGLGLVYNAGERVEGYTNFLWTVFIAGGMKLGFDPILFSEISGIIAFALSLWLTYKIGHFFRKDEATEGYRALFPIAVVSLALHRHSQIFATGGLETSLYTMLTLAGVYSTLKTDWKKPHALPALYFSLAAMTRPDGMLYYGLYVLYSMSMIIFDRKNRNAARIIISQWPFLLIFIPYYVWRWNYYGWPFPNTYYAKSGGGSHWLQGWEYFRLYFESYYVFILLPLLPILYFLRKSKFMPGASRNDRLAFFTLIFFPAVIHTAYYTRIGGDFMFGRFYIPITPLLYITLELLISGIIRNRLRVGLSLAVIIFTAIPFDPYKGQPLPLIHGITEEYRVYRPELLKLVTEEIKQLADVFRRTNMRIAIGGSQAFFAYYFDSVYVIEATGGLTDEYLAHMPLSNREHYMMGHEKTAPPEYLLKKKINIHLNAMMLPGRTEFNVLTIRSLPGEDRILIYEKKKMDILKSVKGISFVDFPSYLKTYLKGMDKLPRKTVRRDYDFFQTYYFIPNANEPGVESARARMERFLKK